MQKFIVGIVGIIFLGAGIFLFIKQNNLNKVCTVETVATVVDMKQELSTDSDSVTYMYYPIIEYKVNSDTIRVTMDSGSSTPVYDIDEKITIMYNPNNAKEYIVKGEKGSAIMSIVMMALGAIITCYGIVVAFKKN